MSPAWRAPVSLDAIVLLALVLTRARTDSFANAFVPRPPELVRQLPFFGELIPENAFGLMRDPLADPLSQVIFAITFLLVGAYLCADLAASFRAVPPRWLGPTKLALLLAIALFSVVGNTAMVMGLRAVSTPSAFAHDGGVLMGDLALKFLFDGQNVYQQSWRGTWVEAAFPDAPGHSQYPYFPFAFLPAAPIYALTTALWGWYDHRLWFLALYALSLAAAATIRASWTVRLCLTAIIALNPILATDLVFGLNDTLLVGLLAAAAWALQRGRDGWAAALIGCALATKGTAWTLAPFAAIYLWRRLGWRPSLAHARALLPAALAFLLFSLPYLAWDPAAMLSDTVLYNAGAPVDDALPIKGWGFGTLVVAAGLVESLKAGFPFSAFIVAIAGPLHLLLLYRQWKANSAGNVFAHYAIGLFVLLYFTRTTNPNYLGYCLSILALGLAIQPARAEETAAASAES